MGMMDGTAGHVPVIPVEHDGAEPFHIFYLLPFFQSKSDELCGIVRRIFTEFAIAVVAFDDQRLPRIPEDRIGIFQPYHVSPRFHNIF